MGKFNWWKRYRPKNKLQRKDAIKGVPFILQQIKHGDFDHSDYKRQADEELYRCEQELQAFVSAYKGNDPKQEHMYLEIERGYRKRYNKLMNDYHWEEANLLADLRQGLVDEFGVDLWEEVMIESTRQDISDAESLFFLYNKMCQEQMMQQVG